MLARIRFTHPEFVNVCFTYLQTSTFCFVLKPNTCVTPTTNDILSETFEAKRKRMQIVLQGSSKRSDPACAADSSNAADPITTAEVPHGTVNAYHCDDADYDDFFNELAFDEFFNDEPNHTNDPGIGNQTLQESDRESHECKRRRLQANALCKHSNESIQTQPTDASGNCELTDQQRVRIQANKARALQRKFPHS